MSTEVSLADTTITDTETMEFDTNEANITAKKCADKTTLETELSHWRDSSKYDPSINLWKHLTSTYVIEPTIKQYMDILLNTSVVENREYFNYNLQVFQIIISNTDDFNAMIKELDLDVYVTMLNKTLVDNLAGQSTAAAHKVIQSYIMPKLFSQGIIVEMKEQFIDIILSTPMGFVYDHMSEKERNDLKNHVLKTYLPMIDPKEFTLYEKMLRVLIHYCGKMLHHEVELTNTFLRIVEFGFKSKLLSDKCAAFDCWKVLIDNYYLDKEYFTQIKQIRLVMKPLKAKLSKNFDVLHKRHGVYTHFIGKLEESADVCIEEYLVFCFGRFSDEVIDDSPDIRMLIDEVFPKSVEVLLKLIGHSRTNCTNEHIGLSDIYKVNQFLYPSNLSKYAEVFLKSINMCTDFIVRRQDPPEQELIDCLWKSIFNLLHNYKEQAVIKLYFYTIQSILMKCTTKPEYIQASTRILKSVADFLNPLEFDETINQELVIPLIRKLYSNQINNPDVLPTTTFTDISVNLLTYAQHSNQFLAEICSLLKTAPPNCQIFSDVISFGVTNIMTAVESEPDTADKYVSVVDDLLSCAISTDCVTSWDSPTRRYKFSNMTNLKAHVVKKLLSIYNDEPKYAMPILELASMFLRIIGQDEKGLYGNLLAIIAICFSTPLIDASNSDKLLKIVDSILEVKIDTTFEFNESIFKCFEELLKVQKIYSVLDKFQAFISQLPLSEIQHIPKSIIAVIAEITNDSNPTLSKTAKTILVKITNSKKKPSTPVSLSRSAKISRMARLSPSALDVPTSSVIKLLGQTVDTVSPAKVRSSLLSLAKNSPSSPRTPTHKNGRKVDDLNVTSDVKLLGQPVDTASPAKVRHSLISLVKNSPNSPRTQRQKNGKKANDLNDFSDKDFVVIDKEVKVDEDKLNEHQKEMSKKKRDIPALYAGLSQSISQSMDMLYNDHRKELIESAITFITTSKKTKVLSAQSNMNANAEPVARKQVMKNVSKDDDDTQNGKSNEQENRIAAPVTRRKSIKINAVLKSEDVEPVNSDKTVKNSKLSAEDKEERTSEKKKGTNKPQNKDNKQKTDLNSKVPAPSSPVAMPREMRLSRTLDKLKMDIVGADLFTTNLPKKRAIKRKTFDENHEVAPVVLRKNKKSTSQKESSEKSEETETETKINNKEASTKKKSTQENKDSLADMDTKINNKETSTKKKSTQESKDSLADMCDGPDREDILDNVDGSADTNDDDSENIIENTQESAFLKNMKILRVQLFRNVSPEPVSVTPVKETSVLLDETEPLNISVENHDKTSELNTETLNITDGKCADLDTETLNITEANIDKLSELDTETLNVADKTAELDTETLNISKIDFIEPQSESIIVTKSDKTTELETETLNITANTDADVSLTLEVQQTPNKSNISLNMSSLECSPVMNDTPERKTKLLKDTSEISPIKLTCENNPPKISPDMFSSENEDIKKRHYGWIESKVDTVKSRSRSEQLLNLLPLTNQVLKLNNDKAGSPPRTPTNFSTKDSSIWLPHLSSPSTGRLRKLMSNCQQKLEESEALDLGDDYEKGYLQLGMATTPAPSATPKGSILKRKAPDTIDEGFSPCAKKKRVNFCDPPTTRKKLYITIAEEKSPYKKAPKKNGSKSMLSANKSQPNTTESSDSIKNMKNQIDNLTKDGVVVFSSELTNANIMEEDGMFTMCDIVGANGDFINLPGKVAVECIEDGLTNETDNDLIELLTLESISEPKVANKPDTDTIVIDKKAGKSSTENTAADDKVFLMADIMFNTFRQQLSTKQYFTLIHKHLQKDVDMFTGKEKKIYLDFLSLIKPKDT